MEKILLVAQEGLNKGGVQTVIMSIVRNLSHKYQFDIILFTKEERYYDKEFESYGGKLFRISFIKNRNRYARRLEKFLRKTLGLHLIKNIIRKNGPYKAIHCHNSIESPTALSAAIECGIRIRVNQIHVVFNDADSNSIMKKRYDELKKQMFEKATTCIGCSELACRSFFKENFQIILNPFDEERFKLQDIETTFGSPKLIQVGNFSDLKNQIYSIMIFKEILKEYPGAHLTLVGHDDGGYEAKMINVIKQLSIDDKIEVYPADADIPQLMNRSSYLLMPSRTESFGIVLVEAQAMGLRCFASDIIPIEPNAGGCKFLSILEDPKVWAEAIIEDFSITKGVHRVYNIDKFKSGTISNQIDQLYNI